MSLRHDAIRARTYVIYGGITFLSGGASHHEAGFHDALFHVVHWVLALQAVDEYLQTKGTVLLVCSRCVDTLLFAPKHDNTNQKNRPFGLCLFPMR